jgi:hypothetical protein
VRFNRIALFNIIKVVDFVPFLEKVVPNELATVLLLIKILSIKSTLYAGTTNPKSNPRTLDFHHSH